MIHLYSPPRDLVKMLDAVSASFESSDAFQRDIHSGVTIVSTENPFRSYRESEDGEILVSFSRNTVTFSSFDATGITVLRETPALFSVAELDVPRELAWSLPLDVVNSILTWLQECPFHHNNLLPLIFRNARVYARVVEPSLDGGSLSLAKTMKDARIMTRTELSNDMFPEDAWRRIPETLENWSKSKLFTEEQGKALRTFVNDVMMKVWTEKSQGGLAIFYESRSKYPLAHLLASDAWETDISVAWCANFYNFAIRSHASSNYGGVDAPSLSYNTKSSTATSKALGGKVLGFSPSNRSQVVPLLGAAAFTGKYDDQTPRSVSDNDSEHVGLVLCVIFAPTFEEWSYVITLDGNYSNGLYLVLTRVRLGASSNYVVVDPAERVTDGVFAPPSRKANSGRFSLNVRKYALPTGKFAWNSLVNVTEFLAKTGVFLSSIGIDSVIDEVPKPIPGLDVAINVGIRLVEGGANAVIGTVADVARID